MTNLDQYLKFSGIALIALFGLSPGLLPAQVTQPTYSCDYANVPLTEALADLESTYPVKFMYRQTDIDSVFLTYKSQELDKKQFLKGLSMASGITFFDHHSGLIILFRNFNIISQFPDNFFGGSSSGDTSSIEIQKTIPFETEEYRILNAQNQPDAEQGLIEVGDIAKRFQGENATTSG